MNIYLYEACILDDKFSDTIKQNENVVKNVCKKIYMRKTWCCNIIIMWDRYLIYDKNKIDWQGIQMSGYFIFLYAYCMLSVHYFQRNSFESCQKLQDFKEVKKEQQKIKQTIAYPICQYPCVFLSNFSFYTYKDLHHRS